MTHMRYWAMTFAVAIGGAFLAIQRFAFAPTSAVWIAFGVAVAAVVLSLAAVLVALLRDNQAFSGVSAISALVAASTVIATLAFTAPTAPWIAFGGGLVLLALSLRGLTLHETTVERVVHQLEVTGPVRPLPRFAGAASRSAAPCARGCIGSVTPASASRVRSSWPPFSSGQTRPQSSHPAGLPSAPPPAPRRSGWVCWWTDSWTSRARP